MKYISAVLALFAWGLITVLMALSMIGMLVMMILQQDGDTDWFNIPSKIIKVFEE